MIGTSTSTASRLLGWGLALGPVLLLAAVHVPFPFGGDQAMFVNGGRALAEGARLYVDFWDMKQPGIFWFSEVAGSLFGFDEVGIHFAELIWMMALAVTLVLLARAHLKHRWLACVAPLLCLGPYYASTGYAYLTVVEILVNLPIAVLLACMLAPASRVRSVQLLHLVAGLMIAVVAVFKLLLLLVPGAIAVVVLGWRLRSRTEPLRVIVKHRLVPMAAGLAAGLAVSAAYLASQQALGAALWASFVYPPLAVEQLPHKPFGQLVTAAGWLWGRTWPLCLLACAAFALPGRRDRLLVLLALLAWVLAAATAVVLQVLSWWIYHMTLLLIPLGLLGLHGIDAGLSQVRRIRSQALARAAAGLWVAVPLYLVVIRPVYYGVVYPMWARAPWTAASLFEYQTRIEPRLAALYDSTRFLRAPGALPGRIALLGDPRVVLLTDRRPVNAINGWTYYLPAQLDEVAATLQRERPPYVYVSWYVARLLSNGNDSVFRVLQRDYVKLSDDAADGSWYRLAQ